MRPRLGAAPLTLPRRIRTPIYRTISTEDIINHAVWHRHRRYHAPHQARTPPSEGRGLPQESCAGGEQGTRPAPGGGEKTQRAGSSPFGGGQTRPVLTVCSARIAPIAAAIRSR